MISDRQTALVERLARRAGYRDGLQALHALAREGRAVASAHPFRNCARIMDAAIRTSLRQLADFEAAGLIRALERRIADREGDSRGPRYRMARPSGTKAARFALRDRKSGQLGLFGPGAGRDPRELDERLNGIGAKRRGDHEG